MFSFLPRLQAGKAARLYISSRTAGYISVYHHLDFHGKYHYLQEAEKELHCLKQGKSECQNDFS